MLDNEKSERKREKKSFLPLLSLSLSLSLSFCVLLFFSCLYLINYVSCPVTFKSHIRFVQLCTPSLINNSHFIVFILLSLLRNKYAHSMFARLSPFFPTTLHSHFLRLSIAIPSFRGYNL